MLLTWQMAVFWLQTNPCDSVFVVDMANGSVVVVNFQLEVFWLLTYPCGSVQLLIWQMTVLCLLAFPCGLFSGSRHVCISLYFPRKSIRKKHGKCWRVCVTVHEKITAYLRGNVMIAYITT